MPIAKAYSGFIVLIPTVTAIKVPVEATSGVSMPLPTNFLLLYLASLSFYAFTIIFDVRCPRIIQERKSRYEFVAVCIDHEQKKASYGAAPAGQDDGLHRAIHEAMAAVIPEPTQQATALDALYREMLRDESSQIRQEELAELEEYWDEDNRSRPYSRLAAFSFMGLSFTVTVWVSLVSTPLRVVSALQEFQLL